MSQFFNQPERALIRLDKAYENNYVHRERRQWPTPGTHPLARGNKEPQINAVLVGCPYLPNRNPAPGPKFVCKLRWLVRFTKYSESLIAAKTPTILAGEGAKVVIGDVLDEQCRKTAADINAKLRARSVIPLHLDVTRAADWRAAVESCQRECAGLDILVNNAGTANIKGIEETSEEEWDSIVNINQKKAYG